MGLEAPKDSRMDQNANLEGIQEEISELKNEMSNNDEVDNSEVDNSKVENSSEVDNSKETENSSEAESSNYIESNIYNKNNMAKEIYKESRFWFSGRLTVWDIVFLRYSYKRFKVSWLCSIDYFTR